MEETDGRSPGEHSAEAYAYRLMVDLANIEGRVLHRLPKEGQQTASRRWILDTYAECIEAVKGGRKARSMAN